MYFKTLLTFIVRLLLSMQAVLFLFAFAVLITRFVCYQKQSKALSPNSFGMLPSSRRGSPNQCFSPSISFAPNLTRTNVVRTRVAVQATGDTGSGKDSDVAGDED